LAAQESEVEKQKSAKNTRKRSKRQSRMFKH